MNKKTKNKFVNAHKVDWSSDELFKDLPPDYYDGINYDDYTKAYLMTYDNQIIQAFPHKEGNEILVIPEPEPSLMFIRNVESKLNIISESRNKVIQSASTKSIPASKVKDDFSFFFSNSFDFLVNLFSSIEAFNNSLIPEDYTFRKNRRIYDRSKIQRFIDFKTKCEIIVPEIKNKSFVNSHPDKYSIILNIKIIRDNLIHTKNQSFNWETSYRDIYKTILKLEFDKMYNTIKDYVIYYDKKDWFE